MCSFESCVMAIAVPGLAMDPHFLLFEWLFVKGNLRSSQMNLVRRFVDAARQGWVRFPN